MNEDKPTKVPYNPAGFPCDITDPNMWASFHVVTKVAYANPGSYDGIGLCLSDNDPFVCIDLDYTEDENELAEQYEIVNSINSYAEHSVSGKGLHIFVKGALDGAIKRPHLEVYCRDRFMAMTGVPFKDLGITYDNRILNELQQKYHQNVSFDPRDISYPQTISDEEVLTRASRAKNGAKFRALFEGKYHGYYKSQSEADFALIDMLTFYTKNVEQIKRLFFASALGKRDKARRVTRGKQKYVDNMVARSFDKTLPKMNFDELIANLKKEIDLRNECREENYGVIQGDNLKSQETAESAQILKVEHSHLLNSLKSKTIKNSIFDPPPGLIGDIAKFIYQCSPRPVPEVSIIAALGMMAGICGRSYNILGTGLNQYLVLLAKTGVGKEAMQRGTSTLIEAVKPLMPMVEDFRGPAEISSGQALIKYLSDISPSFFTILGEFGIRMQDLNNRRNANANTLKRVLLDLYTKSGQRDVLHGSSYSDLTRNVPSIKSPSVTIIGESTPSEFYNSIDDTFLSSGFLPRFTVIEYMGNCVKLNEGFQSVQPSPELLDKVANVVSVCIQLNAENRVIDIALSPHATQVIKDLEEVHRKKLNETEIEMLRQVHSRYHLKVLKLAALLAVGNNWMNPIIDMPEIEWANRMIEYDVDNMTKRFSEGEIVSSDQYSETQQIETMLNAFVHYSQCPLEYLKSKKIPEAMAVSKVMPHKYLYDRMKSKRCFRQDRRSIGTAIERSLIHLQHSGQIAELDAQTMRTTYNARGRAYILLDTTLLL